MSTFSGYKTKAFSESQKFFVLDPNTGSPSFVLGSDLVDKITPNSNYVYSESTRTTAQATDYAIGSLIQTAGATSAGDNFAAVYLVVASGAGDFPMDNGNELLVIAGDELLREQLAKNTAGDGSDLVAHTGTSDTVTQALDKRTIYVGSVAELEVLSLAFGTSVRLTHERRFGDFLVKTGAPPSDPLKGIYIVLANGNYAVRQYGQSVITGAATRPEWFSDDDIGDGVTLAARPIYEAWRLRVSGGAIELNGTSTYLIDDSYGTDLGSGRRVLCWADSEDSPRVIGNGCTVKLVDHDFSAGQGIMFVGGTACRAPKVAGIHFDMTFIGINTSASFYPFGGGVWFRDEPTGVKTQNELNRDVVVEDCTFKLFHPSGQYAESGALFPATQTMVLRFFQYLQMGTI